jgi:putative Ca2+/H+ antiporter (TMEM165/GDT1 family)
MLEILITTYAAVLLAEIVGDKLLYGSGVLATRYHWNGILVGMCLAFMAKMSVAVAVGATIGNVLPKWLVAVVTLWSFVAVAVAMWRNSDVLHHHEKDTRKLKGAAVTFGMIFLSEWGDKGMTTAGIWAAAWASQAESRALPTLQVAFVVWAAAVLAMMTKGGFALTLGASIRTWIAEHVAANHFRYGAVTTLVLLGVLSALEILGIVG